MHKNLRALYLAIIALPLGWHSAGQALDPSPKDDQITYVSSEACASCHQAEYQDWQQSHHWHAMQPASDKSVLGDFNNTEFIYNGITSRFYKREGKFFVLTDNAEGKLQEFEITYTFGIEPLQQYLIDFPDGRKQVLSIIWDTRAKAEGGQRWYHLYPEHELLQHGGSQLDPIDHQDALHWTGSYFNWNSRCAACHSTDLRKNYDAEKNTYKTTWQEVNIGCEACHGQGSQHLAWAKRGDKANPPASNAGFKLSLANKGVWSAIAALQTPEATTQTKKSLSTTLGRTGPSAEKQHQVCATCHSRRSELQQADVNKSFYDSHSLHLLESPQYFSDGQISDEVYVYGSFLQSKMYSEGVTCSNCHNPHSLALKVGKPGDSNGVCSQCHLPSYYDSSAHHHHEKQSAGAQCVSCHMPSETYMGVDVRHDHSFRIPRPTVSETAATPNACTQCHTDRDNQWAASAIDAWLKPLGKSQTSHSFANTFHRIQQRDAQAAPDLMAIALNKHQPDIARATAVLMHDGFFQHTDIEKLKTLLADSDPLVRAAAVRSIQAMPANYRFSLLSARLDEPVLSVRVELARQLADIPLAEIPPREAQLIEGLYKDFLASANFNADFPETQVALGLFYMAQGNYVQAEKSYNKALQLSANHLPALLNLADLYRGLDRDNEGEALLKRAISVQPTDANVHYSLGLLYVRATNLSGAKTELEQATKLQADNPRYAYTYALILEKINKTPEAIAFLETWQKTYPPHPEVTGVLNNLRQKK
ncbi:tetratricopeptide repeat protein [Simiduia curdlanivorans]|uniref:Tetratricopeptide repeat protein n=1 Tax=Simiduia curdlanivorans TaxID=1492769 RepID=A0ABV8V5F8_9GAMM|nr:tetratricopeptide repeat protein [Simiduia curdlanivorans]MDN3638279.1 tetratricopeptide repeat protein [Simiduia curdlanivorans]